ncbi:MAG: NAD(P)-binding protein [Ectothiorhodospiraceae bacterium]|nr:NAD(P)-binding protein [Ectothiorhodospiraceae bacterium]
MTDKRVAVVGGGVAGRSAAWLLSRRYRVTLFEANDYVGGHTNTVEVPGPDEQPMPVDTGFIVYNERNYPLLTSLFRYLGVRTQASDMSFAFSDRTADLEWAGDNLNSLFAQRRNLLRPAFWRMGRDILRFNTLGKRFVREIADETLTLGEFLDRCRAGVELRRNYLLPMAAAIWSCPQQELLEFPAQRFLKFFDNHGLMDLADRPAWRTVSGGGRSYVRRMLPELSGGHRIGLRVERVIRTPEGVRLEAGGECLGQFDEVVIATHADQALRLIDRPSFWEGTLLSGMRYQTNIAYLHTDPRLMPQRRSVWSSWNYLANPDDAPPAVSYWMNRLQGLPGNRQYFVTLNPETPPDPTTVLRRFAYDHPVFDHAAMRAQLLLPQIQGKDRLWFCGSYFGYGFHEDALRSSVELTAQLGVQAPWTETRIALSGAAARESEDLSASQPGLQPS